MITRRKALTSAAALGVGASSLLLTTKQTTQAQPQQPPLGILTPYTNQQFNPGVAGPWPSLAGVDPNAPIPAQWKPKPGAVAALPPLPLYAQNFVNQVITYRPARYGFNNHAYGYDNIKVGFCSHIPVAPSLTVLDSYFTGGANQGLTHFGTGRTKLTDLEVTLDNGDVWRFPVAPVSQYLPIVGPYSPWAQGRIATSRACSIPQHPFAVELGSGVVNGALVSNENVAMSGSDGLTDSQFNSQVLLRVITALYFSIAISSATNIWHAQLDQQDRCFDTGWYGGPFDGIEAESQSAAVALLKGDASKLKGSVKVNQTKPATNWQDEAWRALVEIQARNDRLKIVYDIRQERELARTQALANDPNVDWQALTLQLWGEMAQRGTWSMAEANQQRIDAETQLKRLSS